MKANFKKASVFALAMALVLLMSLSVIPMVSADDAAATTDTYFEIEQNYSGTLAESIGAMKISLSGDIKLMIGYNSNSITADHDYINIKIESANGKKDKSKTVKLSDLTADEDDLIWVEIDVPAAQQTDLVEFKWFDAEGNAGKSRKYSVRYYAEKIMGMASGEIEIPDDINPETVANMDQTVKGMLNYGAASQVALDYNTDNLANKGLYADETNPLDNMLVEHLYDAKANSTVSEESVFEGVQVYLEGSLRIRIYTNAPAGTTVTIDGESFTTSAEGDYSYVGIYNIPANMYDHQFEVVVNGETLKYSVLGYCLQTLNDYKSNEGQKSIAKALYQYYTWTANYAREDYVPGPKDDNGDSTCVHERYYLNDNNVICSDCGENISETTRVSLVPDDKLIIEDGATVTFTLRVVGDVNLSGLIVTPVTEGLTLSNPSVVNLDGTGNIQSEAGINILIDTHTPVTEGCDLVKVTYTVVATNGAGSYKIGLTVQEANGTAKELVVPVTTVLEAVNPACPHETKSGYTITPTGHQWYCDICKQVAEESEPHSYARVWSSADKLYTQACVCGKITGTSDMIYKAESNVSGNAGSTFLSVTTLTTEDGDTFVRFTPTATSDDPFFYPWLDNTTHVTGQFMVIKYRVTNNGNNMTTGALYAGSAAGDTSEATGENGDGSNRLVSGDTLYADGEWHCIIITPNIGTNLNFTANADETYTWKWARINLDGFAALNGSCFFDIDEVAFADNIEAAINYAYNNDVTGKSVRYIAHLDDVECTINNVTFMGDNKNGNTAPIVLDLTNKPLTTPTSLKLGGWVCVDGGVKSYKMRVTSIDGTPVVNPELINWFTPDGLRNDIYEANIGHGYTEDCAAGAGMNTNAVNLTAWENHTITFEIVAVTNYGTELVVVRCTNVDVPCTHKVADDAEWTFDPNDPAFEKTVCSNCGVEVERYIQNTPDDLLIWTPDEIYNKFVDSSNGTVTVLKDENGMPYVQFEATKEFSDEQVEYLYANKEASANNIGKYVAVLWRSTNSTYLEVVVDSYSDYARAGVLSLGTPNANNAWTFSVKPYDAFGSEANKESAGYFDGESFTCFRLDWINNTAAAGDTRDIAFIAYFDSEAEAYEFFSNYAKAYSESSLCDHKHNTTATKWDSAEKIYKFTCSVCGEVVTSKMLHFADPIASGANGVTATQEDGFVRYTATVADDRFVHIYSGGTTVTGKYMVIKYRAYDPQRDHLTLRTYYAGSAMSANTEAAGNGDGIGTGFGEFIADGQWHYQIVSIPDTNTQFEANPDGTYTWKYLRIGFGVMDPNDKPYLDIESLAFADSFEAVEEYVCPNESKPPFKFTIDNGLNTGINGVTATLPLTNATASTTVGSANMANSGKISAANGLAIGGWFVTPGGVASYKYRVTSVDGVAVENPTLIDGWTGGPSEGVTEIGTDMGWSASCGNGCAWQTTNWLDFTGYEDKKITVEIVAVTNYGKEITFLRIENINVVKEAGVYPNYIVDANALSGLTDHGGLTYAIDASGEFVTYTQSTGYSESSFYVTFPEAGINVPAAPTGKYVLIKYRTTYQGKWDMFIGANNGHTHAAGGLDSFGLNVNDGSNNGAIIADGNWQYLILDLKFVEKWGGVKPEDGTTDTYQIDYFRIDPFNSASNVANTVDIAYVAYADSVDKLVDYAGMTSYTFGDSYSGGVVGQTVVVNAADVVVPNYVIDANALKGTTEHTGLTYALDASGDFVTYTQKTDGSSDCYFYATFPNNGVNVPSDPTGKYVLVKYRTTSTLYWQMYIGANNGYTQAKGGPDSFNLNVNNGSNNGAIIADGKWQYLILDLKFVEAWGGVKPEDGTTDTYQIDYFRIDLFNAASNVANTVDIAYVAYADSVDKLVDYAGMTSYTFGDSYSGGVVGQTVVVGE